MCNVPLQPLIWLASVKCNCSFFSPPNVVYLCTCMFVWLLVLGFNSLAVNSVFLFTNIALFCDGSSDFQVYSVALAPNVSYLGLFS